MSVTAVSKNLIPISSRLLGKVLPKFDSDERLFFSYIWIDCFVTSFKCVSNCWETNIILAMVHYLFHQQNSSTAWIGIGRLSLYSPLISFIIISVSKNWWNLARHLMNYLNHIFHTMAHSIPFRTHTIFVESKTLVKWCINKMVYWHK